MGDNEFLLHHTVAERLRVARAAAARQAMLARARGGQREREPGVAISARIVAQAQSGLMRFYRRTILDG
jgi:hypothetical protein